MVCVRKPEVDQEIFEEDGNLSGRYYKVILKREGIPSLNLKRKESRFRLIFSYKENCYAL